MPIQNNPTPGRLDRFLDHFRRISITQKIFFTRHLEVMLRSGLPISQALKTLGSQTTNKKFQRILLDLETDVEKGISLAQSLSKYPKIFPELFWSMVKAGEVSGNLEESLKVLAFQMKKSHDLVAKIKGAMIYPVIVILAMIGIGIAMIIFVIPKITGVFKELGAQLPLATRILIGLSDFVVARGWWILGTSIIGLVILVKVLKTKKGRQVLDHLFLKLPILSPIVKKINLAKFARTMSSLLKTDISIIETFQVTGTVLANSLYRKAVLSASEKVKKGVSLESILKEKPYLFPPLVTQMIAVGEKTGTLDSILDELAQFYEDEISEIMRTLPTIIEPILMIILGGAVAAMAVAIIMPMYSLTEQF